jgi:hypothetical protein
MASTPAYPKQALLSTGRCSYRQHSDTAPLLVHKRSQRDNAIAGFALRRSAAVPRTALAGRRRGQRRLTTSPRPETSCLFYLSAYDSRPPTRTSPSARLRLPQGLCTFVPLFPRFAHPTLTIRSLAAWSARSRSVHATPPHSPPASQASQAHRPLSAWRDYTCCCARAAAPRIASERSP